MERRKENKVQQTERMCSHATTTDLTKQWGRATRENKNKDKTS